MHFNLSEKILVLSGVTMLLGVYIVFSGGSFFVWAVAKIIYSLGVLLFVINR